MASLEFQRSLLAIAAAALFTANLPHWFVSLAPIYAVSTGYSTLNGFNWNARDRPQSNCSIREDGLQEASQVR